MILTNGKEEGKHCYLELSFNRNLQRGKGGSKRVFLFREERGGSCLDRVRAERKNVGFDTTEEGDRRDNAAPLEKKKGEKGVLLAVKLP